MFCQRKLQLTDKYQYNKTEHSTPMEVSPVSTVVYSLHLFKVHSHVLEIPLPILECSLCWIRLMPPKIWMWLTRLLVCLSHVFRSRFIMKVQVPCSIKYFLPLSSSSCKYGCCCIPYLLDACGELVTLRLWFLSRLKRDTSYQLTSMKIRTLWKPPCK